MMVFPFYKIKYPNRMSTKQQYKAVKKLIKLLVDNQYKIVGNDILGYQILVQVKFFGIPISWVDPKPLINNMTNIQTRKTLTYEAEQKLGTYQSNSNTIKFVSKRYVEAVNLLLETLPLYKELLNTDVHKGKCSDLIVISKM